jgi:hypothetical protein
MMVKFRMGDKSVWINSDQIVKIRDYKTDDQGPTTKMETVKFGHYFIVDGTAEENVAKINEAIK